MQVYQCPKCRHELGAVEIFKNKKLVNCPSCHHDYLVETLPQGVRIDCPPAYLNSIAKAGGEK